MEKATREQTKTHNTSLVLKTIYQQGDTSRADIARITNLTRTTVSEIVAELMEVGLLVETGIGESAGGKPPILIKVQENARQLICIDLSAHPFTGALINLRGSIVRRAAAESNEAAFPGNECVPTSALTGQPAVEAVYRLLDALIPAAQAPLIGIGVGVPGLTDAEKGVVRRSVHLDWTDLPLAKLLSDRYQLPMYLINDSHAAALAEYTFGEMHGASNLIVVRIGEGIGTGILLSGRLHYGDGFGAGEIGHLTVVEGGRLCSCGNYGCLETVAAPPAIVQRMRELAEYDWVSFTGKNRRGESASPKAEKASPEEINWDFVRSAFFAGDEIAARLVQEAGHYLGVSIANLVSILNVRRIVISGCYSEFGDTFLQAVSAEVKRHALPTTVAETQIVHSGLGRDIVTLGVSALVLSEEMGLP